MKRALISVYDKTGVVEFAKFLAKQGIEIISTGGTYKLLKDNYVDVLEINEVTKADEMLDGRVKTLHPVVHGGILAVRSNEEHMATLRSREIETIDIVVVNLYPFFEQLQQDNTFDEMIEFIDIGGPTMLRSAAKNFQDVTVISDVTDYAPIMEEMKAGEVSYETKKRLAGKVFNLTAAYDGAISQFMLGESAMPEYFHTSYVKKMDLRYGENPHQNAAYYESTVNNGAMKGFKQLNGKELSFNNIRDMDVAWKIVNEFSELTCCGLKHSTPCGVATGKDAFDAYKRAHDCDPISIFGGIVAINRPVTKAMAEECTKIFLEIVIAPEFDADALEVLKTKKNLRVIKANKAITDPLDIVKVDGGLLVQDADRSFSDKLDVVTDVKPSDELLADMVFGQKIVKHVKSNAIVVVKDGMAIGIGTGETNRIWATEQAIERAGDGVVLASDAFFPFDDVVKACGKAGIKGIIQPGGSMRDEDSIKAANELNIPMVFTGMRHFKH